MSDYYLIGENVPLFSVSSANWVRSIVYNDVIYVYYRHSTVEGLDVTSSIKVTTSTDGVTWTAPVTAYSKADRDVAPAGVVYAGGQFVMTVAEVTVSGAVTTRLLGSATGITYAGDYTIPWGVDWAHPTGSFFDGTLHYFAASVRIGTTGPRITTVMTANAGLGDWTSLGYVSQLTSADNTHARITVDSGTINVIFREGDFWTQSDGDRLLHTTYANGAWRVPTVALEEGGGNPDILPLTTGYAVIYLDQSIEGGYGIWSWLYYDGSEFYLRGTFTQGYQYGLGGSLIPRDEGFAVVYSNRTADESTVDGYLYYRTFTEIIDEPADSYFPRRRENQPQRSDQIDFSLEISYGSVWISLSDRIRFYTSAEDYGDKAQTLRRIEASSPYFDGTYVVHSTRDNVQETVTVGVLGASQNQVTENLLLLEDIISQPKYQMRLTVGDHVETWDCFSADYTVSRGHIMLHNVRAMMKLSIPRLPQVTYEVV